MVDGMSAKYYFDANIDKLVLAASKSLDQLVQRQSFSCGESYFKGQLLVQNTLLFKQQLVEVNEDEAHLS